MTGKIIPFPRAKHEDLLRLPLADRYWLTRQTDALPCGICSAPVYPAEGMWWDEDGLLHNYSCRGYSGRVPA